MLMHTLKADGDSKSVRDLPSIKAFIQQDKAVTLLYLVMPFCSRLLVRQIIEQPVEDHLGSFTIRSRDPLSSTIDSQVQASDAFVLHGNCTEDLLLAEVGKTDSLHLVAGPPGTLAKTIKLDVTSVRDGLHLQDLPLHLTSQHGLLQLELQTDPRCSLTATVMSVTELIMSPEHFRALRMAWIQIQPKTEAQEWAVLTDLLLWRNAKTSNEKGIASSHQMRFVNLLRGLGTKESDNLEKEARSEQISSWSQIELAKMVQGLNLIAQNARIDVCDRKRNLPRLAALIMTLAHRLGWSNWLDYWLRLVPNATSTASDDIVSPSIPEAVIFDIVDYTTEAIKGHFQELRLDMISLLPRLEAVIDVFACFASETELFDTMSGLAPSTAGKRAKAVVEGMLKHKIGVAELTRMPISLALPLRQAMKQCEKGTPSRWSAQAYLFVGRADLAKQITPLSSSDSDVLEDPNGHISSRLFPNDYRLREVKEMLQTSRPIATKGPEAAGMEDQEVIAEQQKRVFVSASDRIKSLSVGRGMFSMSSVSFKSTEQWKTSPLCLRIRILNNCIIQHREPDAESADLEWPEFHNGVASALQLAISQDKIESSWLYSQLNKEFNPRHAGLIFGIGLLGQLRNLGKIHAHYYLSSRHSATTIGLLLGISLSFLGSCDPLAKALMSIHLIHTLPTHSRPLKTSMLEQSAALVGLGFVFMASRDRWASRMAFKAIATETVMTDDSQMLKRECFSLSAAISLGLTCLGQGRTPTSLAGEIEEEIIPGLESLIIAFDLHDSREELRRERVIDDKNYAEFEWKPDISLSTSPASIALALIYLKSNRQDKAEKMPLPQSANQLEKIRPDLLSIRAICRSLILWDDIQPDSAWLNGILPAFLQYENTRKVSSVGESCQMAYWSLRVGYIFAIGLKFAGSNDSQARKCLLDELHHFQSQVEIRPASYFDKIRQQMLQNSIDVILTSLSIVLAGTGDVEVLQHLRRGLYRVDNLRYGNYMATSMSIGMLFLGAGRFTLSTSDSAIVALLIAFYPRYPVNAQDNRCHLQAYRHLWLLAVEARLLSVEDVDSGESSRMPVDMQLEHSGEIDNLIISMPCLLPKVQEVKSIGIASDRYYSSKLDIRGNPLHQKAVVGNRKLYVKKKAADLSHDEDKWGKSSIRARAGDFIACKQLPLSSNEGQKEQREGRMQESKRLRELIKGNVHDKDVLSLVDIFVGPIASSANHSEQEEAFELFVLQSILDCLLQDKLEIVPMVTSLYSSTQSFLNQRGELNGGHDVDIFFLRDLKQLLVINNDQYKNVEDKSSSMMMPLLDRTFVKALWTLIQDKFALQLTQDQALRKLLQEYVSAVSIRDSHGRHQLACLLIVADVPPLSLLLEIKNLVVQQGEATSISAMQALVKMVLLEMGYQTKIEVIQVLIETWLS
jgi:anaphase-promoting complex subunit 1